MPTSHVGIIYRNGRHNCNPDLKFFFFFSVCFLSCRHNQLPDTGACTYLCEPQNPWESPLPDLCWLLFRGSLSGSLPLSEAPKSSWGCHKSNSVAALRVGKGRRKRRERVVCYYQFTGEAQAKSDCKLHSDGFVWLCESHQLEHLTVNFEECK